MENFLINSSKENANRDDGAQHDNRILPSQHDNRLGAQPPPLEPAHP